MRSNGFLATFNGPWLKDCEALWKIVHSCRYEIEALPDAITNCQPVVQLFLMFWKEVQDWKEGMRWKHVSCSLEVSLNSEEPRVHFHLMVSFDKRKRWEHMRDVLRFQGILVGSVEPCTGRGVSGLSRALREGHYYCQCMKVGALIMATNWYANRDFLVDQVMVKRLWRKRKLNHKQAIRELINCRDRSPNAVAEVERAVALEYRQVCRRLQEDAEMNWAQRPWKPAMVKEIEWLLQYEHLWTDDLFATSLATQALREHFQGPIPERNSKQRRFYFLIYDGASHTGKTERAISWFGWQRTRVCNCHKICTPNLRQWLSGSEKAIVFEECDWKLIAENKLLFQATTRPVTLSQSQCNEAAYDVWVHGTPMICTSNDFWRGCNDEEMAAWIRLNAYYVWVDEPLFVSEEAQQLLLPLSGGIGFA